MNEHIEIDLEINDGQVDIDIEVDTGVPNYLTMLTATTPSVVNETVYPLDVITPYTFAGKYISEINLPNVREIQGKAFANAYFEQEVIDFPACEKLSRAPIPPFGLNDYANCAFKESTLNEIHLDNVTDSGSNSAFSQSKVQRVSMRALENIEFEPFQSCEKLQYFYLPNIKQMDVRTVSGSNVMTYAEIRGDLAVFTGSTTGPVNSMNKLETLSLPDLKNCGYSRGSWGIAVTSSKLTRLYVPKLKTAYPYLQLVDRPQSLKTLCLPSLEDIPINNCITNLKSSTDELTIYTPKLKNFYCFTNSTSYTAKTLNVIVGDSESTEPATCRWRLLYTENRIPTAFSIYVPDHLLEEYKAATNWAKYASYIKPQSEIPDELIAEINENLQCPVPPDDYMEWLESMGVDYWADLEKHKQEMAALESEEATA